MNSFTIKDLENLSGIKAHTIRIWEQRYSFLKPQRSDTNIRHYSNDELKAILNIALLNKYGYKISHIDKMTLPEINDKLLTLSQSQAQQERIVNDLIQLLIDLEIEKIDQTLNNYIHAKGIEKTITQIIFPFLERIGILWLTNHVNPAQEHLVSNLIRQKIIIGIENCNTEPSSNETVLLFLPEGEHHELGLLFISYLLKNKGVKSIYLGADVPLKDVEFVARLKKTTHIYCHLTSLAHNFNFDKFLHNLQNTLTDYKILISGQVCQQYKKKVPDNVILLQSLSAVMEYIGKL